MLEAAVHGDDGAPAGDHASGRRDPTRIDGQRRRGLVERSAARERGSGQPSAPGEGVARTVGREQQPPAVGPLIGLDGEVAGSHGRQLGGAVVLLRR